MDLIFELPFDQKSSIISCYFIPFNNFNCSRNLIKDILPSFGCTEQIEYLNLSYNFIDYLPIELGALKNLKSLNLSHNRLSSFPKIDFPSLEKVSFFQKNTLKMFSVFLSFVHIYISRKRLFILTNFIIFGINF